MKIALVGNPNSGKTTMFNELTGSAQYVGNWPGVTIEKKEGFLKGHPGVVITDLPGIYSLSPYTPEEVITRNHLLDDRPDVVINLVDATNIERNLYLTTQLLETGLPVVVALNMIDIIRKSGSEINIAKLRAALGCEIVEISALKGIGLSEVSQRAIEAGGRKKSAAPPEFFGDKVSAALFRITNIIKQDVPREQLRWYAVKAFERDSRVLKRFSGEKSKKIEEIIKGCETELDDSSESIIANERYEYITKILKGNVKKPKAGKSITDRIDSVLTNRWLALPIFAAIMWGIYYVSVTSLGGMLTDWTTETLFDEIIAGWVGSALSAMNTADWLISLVIDGVIGGVGAVLGFVPQIMILFFFLSILEDSGYMARVAFIMDKLFKRFGLSGKSFIPMLISSGCGVPGIMACRTIENEKDRKITIMVTTFIPCSAKLPIIALIASAFFKGNSLAPTSIYFLGIAMVVVSGVILKKTKALSGDASPFVMELPPYRLPELKGIVSQVVMRSRAFIAKAGTVIFAACIVIWGLSNLSWSLRPAAQEESMLFGIGAIIAPIFAPLGFGDWRAAIATITGLIAKENVVGTFGVLSGGGAGDAFDGVTKIFTAAGAYSFMAFNMICAPCVAAIGAIKREMGGWRWTLITVGYQTALAYAMSLIIYQLGSLFFLGARFSAGTGAALAVLALVLWLLFRKGDVKIPGEAARVIV